METDEKKVMVNLGTNKEVLLSELLQKGYNRFQIINLFETLQSLNFGVFVKGTRGRGQSGKFIKQDNCPQEYFIIVAETKKGRPKGSKNSKPKQQLKENHKVKEVNKIVNTLSESTNVIGDDGNGVVEEPNQSSLMEKLRQLQID